MCSKKKDHYLDRIDDRNLGNDRLIRLINPVALFSSSYTMLEKRIKVELVTDNITGKINYRMYYVTGGRYAINVIADDNTSIVGTKVLGNSVARYYLHREIYYTVYKRQFRAHRSRFSFLPSRILFFSMDFYTLSKIQLQ